MAFRSCWRTIYIERELMTDLEKLEHVQAVLEEALELNIRLTRSRYPDITKAIHFVDELKQSYIVEVKEEE